MRKREKFPNTRFQRWLSKNGACPEARRAVGRKTIKEAWRTTRSRDWMFWFLAIRWERNYTNTPGRENTHVDFSWYEYLGVNFNWELNTKRLRDRVEAKYIRL